MKRRSLLQSIGAGIVAGLAAVFAPASVIAAVHPAVDYREKFRTTVLKAIHKGDKFEILVPNIRSGYVRVWVSKEILKLWQPSVLRHGVWAVRDPEKGLEAYMQFIEAFSHFTSWEDLVKAQSMSHTSWEKPLSATEHSAACLYTDWARAESSLKAACALPPADWL